LLKPGLEFLEEKTGKPVLGVIPYFRDITIAQEDSVYLDERENNAPGEDLDVAVIRFPRISNYDDFDPLEANKCTVRYIREVAELGNPNLIILPGTKSTIADLKYLRNNGLDRAIIKLAKAGTPVIGICGGYQMLGKVIEDPNHVESSESSIPGLGLLDIETVFEPVKSTTQVKAIVNNNSGLLSGTEGIEITGYEIHMGQTIHKNCQPAFQVLETPQGKTDYIDGAVSNELLIFGSYIHGLFDNTRFTHILLNLLRQRLGLPSGTAISINKEVQYDKLAELVRQNLDMNMVYEIAMGK
jgi:adenosylcobyric acid synthase